MLTAALLSMLALLVWVLPPGVDAALHWQPALARRQPWRLWTAAVVHWSPSHLLLNLAGAALVAVLGWVVRAPASLALAWALAWPLAHVGLWLQPALPHYGGLSAVLHGGAALVALHLLVRRRGWPRRAGGLLALALLIKLLRESPWGPALQPDAGSAGSDLLLAPWAHVSGVLAAVAAAAVVAALTFSVRRARARLAPVPPPATG